MVTYQPEQTDVFHALADVTRRALLDRLRSAQMPVQDLAKGFDMSRPAVSKHLRVLRESGLVHERRKGRHRFYSLHPDPLRDVDEWLSSTGGSGAAILPVSKNTSNAEPAAHHERHSYQH